MTYAKKVAAYEQEYAEFVRALAAHEADPSEPAPTRYPINPAWRVPLDLQPLSSQAEETEIAGRCEPVQVPRDQAVGDHEQH